MVEENDFTTIAIKKTTRDRLAEHGEYGDNMDDILVKVLDKVKKR